MTPEFIRDELFRPFATTKGGGHGIGAYQARELLREAGGDLLVISRRAGGTTMRLLLPSVRGLAVARCRAGVGVMSAAMAKPKLLIVEDDEGVCAPSIAGRFPPARC